MNVIRNIVRIISVYMFKFRISPTDKSLHKILVRLWRSTAITGIIFTGIVVALIGCVDSFYTVQDTDIWKEQIDIVFRKAKQMNAHALLNSVGLEVANPSMPFSGLHARLSFFEPRGKIICSSFDDTSFAKTFKIEECGTFKGTFDAGFHEQLENAFYSAKITPLEALQQTVGTGVEWLRTEDTKGHARIRISFHPLDKKDVQIFGIEYVWIVTWTASNDQGIKELLFIVNPTDGMVLQRKEHN